MPHGTVPQLALSSLDSTGSSHRLTPTAPAALANKDGRARDVYVSARHVSTFAITWPGLRAACAHLRHASEARPGVSSVAPRKPADPLADRHRPWRNR